MKTLQRGVTLIELAIVLAVVALLYSQAAPSFAVWIKSAQIRTAAESMQNGLQLARAEAISGHIAKAGKAYQDFFAIWKSADADIPILKEAKLEYATLR